MSNYLDPEYFARLQGDSHQRSDALAWLRQQDEVAKFEYVWRVLRADTMAGGQLAARAQLKPIFLEAILEYGCVYADASSIKWILEGTINGLGHKRLLELVRHHLRDAPLVVYKVLYWLPRLSIVQPDQHEAIQALQHEFESQYPNFRSTRSTGIHATGVPSNVEPESVTIDIA
jgi:hypothetical protein